MNARPAELHDSRAFGAWGRLLYRNRRAVLWLWFAAIAIIVPTIPFLPGRVRLGGFDDPSLPSSRALAALRDELGFPTNSAAVFYTIDGRDYVDPAVRRVVGESVARAGALPGVKHAIGPDLNSRQVGRSGRAAFALLALETEPGQGGALLADLERAVAVPASTGITIETSVVSADSFFRDLQEATTNDLRRAELITVPVAAFTLLAVFGSVVAAGVPVIAGAATAIFGLGGIFLLSFVADMSVFTLNLASMLALGLGTDYALFLVSRYREEIDRGADPEQKNWPSGAHRRRTRTGRPGRFDAGGHCGGAVQKSHGGLAEHGLAPPGGGRGRGRQPRVAPPAGVFGPAPVGALGPVPVGVLGPTVPPPIFTVGPLVPGVPLTTEVTPVPPVVPPFVTTVEPPPVPPVVPPLTTGEPPPVPPVVFVPPVNLSMTNLVPAPRAAPAKPLVSVLPNLEPPVVLVPAVVPVVFAAVPVPVEVSVLPVVAPVLVVRLGVLEVVPAVLAAPLPVEVNLPAVCLAVTGLAEVLPLRAEVTAVLGWPATLPNLSIFAPPAPPAPVIEGPAVGPSNA